MKIEVNGKLHDLGKCQIINLVNNPCFFKLFTDDLLEYVKNTIPDERERCKALKNLHFNQITTLDGFHGKHTKDGYSKSWNKTFWKWPKEISSHMKGNSFRGKKRPEHSVKMKSIMLGIDRGDSFREIKKKQNAGIEFKKTFLQNKNINILNLKDEEVLKVFSKFISNHRKSPKHKIDKLKRFIQGTKYEGNILFEEFQRKYTTTIFTENNVEEIYPQMMSVISSIAISKNNNMGSTKFFKKGFVEVRYCKNKTMVLYRSSWELITTQFLENQKIAYEYEPFYIEKESGYYLPDYIFELNGEKIMLEIKGFIRGLKGKINEEAKKQAAIEYCKNNNMRYIYLIKPLTSLEQLKTIK